MNFSCLQHQKAVTPKTLQKFGLREDVKLYRMKHFDASQARLRNSKGSLRKTVRLPVHSAQKFCVANTLSKYIPFTSFDIGDFLT